VLSLTNLRSQFRGGFYCEEAVVFKISSRRWLAVVHGIGADLSGGATPRFCPADCIPGGWANR
jgi:hypothetical protein